MGVGAHRPGPVQRKNRGDVLEVVRDHRPQQCAHRTTVELEHTEGVAPGQQVVGRSVGELEILEHHGLPAVARDVGQAVVEHGQVAQPEEVHLEQAEGLADPHVELRDDRAVLITTPDRDHVEQGLGAQDHARRVYAGLPLEAFEALGRVDDLAHVGVAVVERPELGGLGVAVVMRVEDAVQRDVLAHDRRRHRLGDALADGEGVAERARRVLDRRLRLDRAVGDDLGDALLAVLLRRVADHLRAPTLVEVHVDVGHRHTLGIEEALEQQAVDQGV